MSEPVALQHRISSIDVLRGVALLGILILNIQEFGDVSLLHDLPSGSAVNVFTSPHAHLDFAAILLSWLFFEGKMRGLFSMLFGAGIILLTSRAERRGSRDVADIYTRRNMWLMLFGILHSCLIWDGDILLDYGLAALLFLFPMRRLSTKALLWSGAVLSVVLSSLLINAYTGFFSDVRLDREVRQVHLREQAHQPLSAADRDYLAAWDKLLKEKTPSPQKTAEQVKKAKAPYRTATLARSEKRAGHLALTILFLLFDAFPAMLLGMGLMKCGFFTLELETSVYLWTALLGFAISLPLYILGIVKAYAAHFFFITAETWVYAPYEITRTAGMLAITAVALLAIRYRIFPGLQRALQAVGRTAFTNYIITSLICQTIFVWGPHPLFGKLDFYQLMLVAVAVWVINLTLSVLWLRRFAFGPLEWLWRSLTYWKPQPMLLRATTR